MRHFQAILIAGELIVWAERKAMIFDPLPDADNAAAGSHTDFFGDTRTGISILLDLRTGLLSERRNCHRVAGERLTSVKLMRWELVFRGERWK